MMENTPIVPHKLGLLFDAPEMIQDERLTFNPFLRWVGGRYFRRAGAVMLNDPWLSPPYLLPLRRHQNSLTEDLTPLNFVEPPNLYRRLMNSQADRAALLSSVDLLIFIGRSQPGAATPDPLVTLDSSHHWSCTDQVWYSVCEKPNSEPGLVPVPKNPGPFEARAGLYR
jgi:hypothetical protein